MFNHAVAWHDGKKGFSTPAYKIINFIFHVYKLGDIIMKRIIQKKFYPAYDVDLNFFDFCSIGSSPSVSSSLDVSDFISL